MNNCHQLHPDLLNLISQVRHIEKQLHALRGEAQECETIMRLAGRVTRLKQKYKIHERRFTRSASVSVDSRYPKDQLNQFIAEHGFDDPDCLLVVRSYANINPVDPIIEPYVNREIALV
jgi:hypothetical protein